jgi:hypothetical protein
VPHQVDQVVLLLQHRARCVVCKRLSLSLPHTARHTHTRPPVRDAARTRGVGARRTHAAFERAAAQTTVSLLASWCATQPSRRCCSLFGVADAACW